MWQSNGADAGDGISDANGACPQKVDPLTALVYRWSVNILSGDRTGVACAGPGEPCRAGDADDGYGVYRYIQRAIGSPVAPSAHAETKQNLWPMPVLQAS